MAKQLLISGKAKGISDAVKKANISRSSYYKYKDFVFNSSGNVKGNIATIECSLEHVPGILSEIIDILAKEKANILTINQTIPLNDIATRKIHGEILAAYRSAETFLRLTPAMPMHDFDNARAIAPVATLGAPRRAELAQTLALAPDEHLVLIAYGGFERDLGAGRWPPQAGIRWLTPQAWNLRRPDMTALESLISPDLTFPDLLASVDALLAKPGYGTFVEAACNGVPVLYQRRDDWPEQDCLIDWLKQHNRCQEIAPDALARGDFKANLETLWRLNVPPRPRPDGIAEAARLLHARLAG